MLLARGRWRVGFAAVWWSMRLEPLVVSVLILALLGTWAVSRAVEAQISYSRLEAQKAEARDLAGLLADHWRQRVRQVAHLQRLVERGFYEAPATRSADAVRQAIDAIGGGIAGASAWDSAGRALWSVPGGDLTTPPPQPGMNHSISAWDDGVAFSTEYRDTNDNVLGGSSILVKADMAGMLANAAHLIGSGAVMLARGDGTVLARAGSTRLFTDRGLPSALARQKPKGTVSHSAGPGGGFYGVAPVAGADLLILVALSAADAMAPVNVAVTQVDGWTMALCLVLVVMAFAVNIVFRRSHSLSLERRRNQELHERESLLRDIADTASDLIVILDARMRALFINPAYRAMLGGDPEAMQGQVMGGRILAEDFERVRMGAAALRKHGGSWRGTFRARHDDGSIRWLETEIVSVSGGGGAGSAGPRFVAICRDVTGRIQDEAALRSDQADLNALVRLGPGTFYRMAIRAPDHQADRWFPAGCDLLGVSAATSDPEARFLDRVHAADRPLLADALRRCMASGDATAEYRLARPDHELRWVRDRMRLVKASGDENILFGYMVEITQEREDMSRLRQVERLATLGEVATGIAHEMNQPLAAIAMAAENGLRLLDHGADRARLSGKLARIADHVHRLSEITDAVHLFGRADGNTTGSASLEDVLRNVRVLVKPRLTATGVRLVVHTEPDLPLLRASPVALEQALMNLIANACDAYATRDLIEPGDDEGFGQPSPVIPNIVRLYAMLDGDHIRITVADRAGGIPPEAIDRIFNPFFTTKPPGKGTGLGLSISYARVAEMGGRISVRNRDGGAVFDILMPTLSTGQRLERAR